MITFIVVFASVFHPSRRRIPPAIVRHTIVIHRGTDLFLLGNWKSFFPMEAKFRKVFNGKLLGIGSGFNKHLDIGAFFSSFLSLNGW